VQYIFGVDGGGAAGDINKIGLSLK